MSRQDNIETIVSIVGDDRLSKNQVVERAKGLANDAGKPYSKQTIYQWLRIACRQGVLDRVKITRNRTREHFYFATGNDPYIEPDREPFIFEANCPACGQAINFTVAGYAELETLYAEEAWSCGGCGDYVRFGDCVDLIMLRKSFCDWRDSEYPDHEIRIPTAYMV